MECPNDIAVVLLRIINTALLRIRRLAQDGMSERCEIEADHVHNLPSLLEQYSDELLVFYWNVERPEFISQSPENSQGQFSIEWDTLSQLLERHGINVKT